MKTHRLSLQKMHKNEFNCEKILQFGKAAFRIFAYILCISIWSLSPNIHLVSESNQMQKMPTDEKTVFILLNRSEIHHPVLGHFIL